MDCAFDSLSPAPPDSSQRQTPPYNPLPDDYEYDFVEDPPKDFYCAVSFELLLDPQQTYCCGHHFTNEITERLKSEKKPCPMCKKEPLSTHPDLYHRRRVNQVAVRCLYKDSGNCERVVELGNLRDHVTNCPKQPWKCVHCDFAGLKETELEHSGTCTMFPVECPNKCPVGTVPRGELDRHKLVCVLEEVSCEYAALGCTKRFPRKDMQKHLKEGETEHLVKMCATNLTLTQQLVRKVAEKDDQIAQLQSQLVTMEDKLEKSVRSVQESTSVKIERQIKSHMKEFEEQVARNKTTIATSISSMKSSLLNLQQQVDAISCRVPPLEFVVNNYEALKTMQLEWRSPPFYTHHSGYKMCIGVYPYGIVRGLGTHVSLRIYKMLDSNSDRLPWDIPMLLRVHIQNQCTGEWEREYIDISKKSKPKESCEVSFSNFNYLRHSDTKHYVKNDQLRIRVTSLNICV